MRIRTKTWARPELKASDYFIEEAKDFKGKWREFFGNDNPIHLDLGCGKCTFLAEIAYKNPNINYIGVDISLDILGVARRNISAKFDEKPVKNVALCSYNIEKILDIVGAKDNVERIYINFCNPWPNSGHHKRRLTHTLRLKSYREVLKDGGELWFKTDNTDLYIATKRYMKESGFEMFFDTMDLKSLSDKENIVTEHEEMYEKQKINIKAIRAKKLELKTNDESLI